MNNLFMNISNSLIGLLAACLFAASVQAETLYERLLREYRNDSEELGVRAGSLRLDPSVSLGITHNSNVFATSNDEESDQVTSLRPALRLRNLESPHLLQLIAGAELANYSDLSSEDYDDATVAFNADWELNESNALGLTLAYEEGHEDRTSSAARNGVELTDLDESKAQLIYRGTRGWADFGFELRHQTFDYGRTVLADGTVLDNEDRDHDRIYAAIDAGLSDEQRYSPYIRLGRLDRNFDNVDGLDRSSDSSFAHLGLRTTRQAVLSSDFYFGYAWNNFTDNRFEDFNDFVVGGELSWWPTRLTNITGQLRREVNGTTLADAAGTESTKLRLALDHELRRYMNLSVVGGYGSDDYVNLDREDTDIYGMIELTRDMGRKLRIGAAYTYSDRSVSPDVSDAEYTQSLFTLFVRGRL